MNTVATPAPSRSVTLPWLVATQAVMLLSLAPWAMITGFSYMTAGAREAFLPAPLLYLVWIYPVLPVVCVAAAWAAHRRGDGRRAMRLTSLPLVAAVPLLAYFAWLVTAPTF